AGATGFAVGMRVAAMILGQHEAGDVDLAAADMGVHVDGAGHDDLAAQVVFLRHGFAVGRRCDDAAVTDKNVHDLAIDLVRRIVDPATAKLDQHDAFFLGSAASRAASTSSSLGSGVSRNFFNGSATELSLRNWVPRQSMPGTATGMKTSGSCSNCMAGWPRTTVGTVLCGDWRLGLKLLIH